MPWNNIKSQPFVCDLLQRALKNQRMHHGYIFVGDPSETEPVALAFAQSQNCEKSAGDFCGECASCRDIAKNQYPDVYALRAESKSRRIVINQVRELERSVYLKPSRARTKVAMIHCADRLQPEAQDAFLKTLEEPPPQTIFLLLTDEPQQLKETILSRCLRISFRPGARKQKTPNEEQVEAWLTEFCKSSKPGSSAVCAYGFVGKVLTLLKEVRDLKTQEAEELLGDPSYDHLESSQRQRLEEQMMAQAQADYLQERSRILKSILEWFHENRPGPKSVEILEDLGRRLSRNVNESLAWEIAFLKLAESN
jgi:DNA polymerase III subunit delta'